MAKVKVKPLINIKVSKIEKRKLQGKANKYSESNLSLWLRYAAMKFKPKASDLKKLKQLADQAR